VVIKDLRKLTLFSLLRLYLAKEETKKTQCRRAKHSAYANIFRFYCIVHSNLMKIVYELLPIIMINKKRRRKNMNKDDNNYLPLNHRKYKTWCL